MNRLLLFCVSLFLFLFYASPGYSSEIKRFSNGKESTLPGPASAFNVFKDSDITKLPLAHARLDGQSYHVFSHGKPGELLINGKWLDAKGIVSFLKNQTDAASFSSLNIYGCEFGKGEAGRAAVSYLGNILGVAVSASDDLTGKDGDWDLEVGTYVSVKGLENFSGNLQCIGTVGGTAPGDDFDGDGICNDTDIDDDNDGVPDAIESPGCFYTEAEAKTIASVTSELTAYSTNVIGFSYDNNTATESGFANAQNWVDKSIFEITPTKPIAISAINFDVGSWALSTNTSATFKLQGWSGSAWVDLSAAMYSTGTGASDFSISNTLQVGTKYAKYRIVGVAGTCSYGGIKEITLTAYQYIASAYPKPTCSTDLDSDSKYNHQDLDSDGDGSPDLAEAGVSPTTDVLVGPPANAQLNPSAADTNNDGLNDSVDSDLNGIVNYTSTYGQYALTKVIRASNDADGDNIAELADYDDDNDGILDAVESPDCFYTEAQAKAITSVTTELVMATGVFITASYDGNTSTQSSFTASQDWVNKTIFEITPTTPIAISSVNFDVGTWALSANTSSTFKLQGWNGSSWVDLSAAMYSTGTGASDFSISNTLQVGSKYAKYRITGVAGTCSNGGIMEITLTAYQYVPSLNPKSTCATDTDGDGIFNHQDLDSDGDGCADAIEGGGGFTTSNLKESSIPKGNSGGTYTGIATFGVDDNLGNTVNGNGVPTVAGSGQTLGQSQTAASTACTEFCLVNIGGTVYRDSDGASNGVNGTAVNGVTSGLYMSLVSGSTLKSVTGVLANGTYSFTSVETGTYKLILGTSSSGSVSVNLPGSATAVVEGGNIVAGVSMGDGTPDGKTEITVTCPQSDAYTHIDFGVLGGPFPVTLISFNAQQTVEGTKLTWRTTEEKDFDRFQIEYSELPQNGFSTIGEIKGGGAEYVYTDAVLRRTASYYRLKMIDTDGTYAYSKIVSIQSRNGKELYRVYPNPSNGRITHVVTNGPIESFKIYDASGAEISATMTGQGGQYEFRFTDQVQAGLYIITYKTSGRLISQKFVLND